MSTRSISWG